MKKGIVVTVLALALASGAVGCSNMSRSQQGTLSGAALGAAAGAGIAAIAGGYAGWGALAGAGVGALAGNIISK